MTYGRLLNTFAKNPVRSLAAGTAANAAYRAAGYYLNQNKKDAMPKDSFQDGHENAEAVCAPVASLVAITPS